MTKTVSLNGAAISWAAAVVLAPGGASTACAAATAVDIPAQVFASDPTSVRPVTAWKSAVDVPPQGPDGAAGRSYRVDLPLGAGKRWPLIVHIISSEEKCHDNNDSTPAAAAANRDQDFIRGGEHW